MHTRKPSKLNKQLDVPATPATVMPAVPIRAAPCPPAHITDVTDAQLLVEHSAKAIRAVGEAFNRAKLNPASVDCPGVAKPAFKGDTLVMTGAGRRC